MGQRYDEVVTDALTALAGQVGFGVGGPQLMVPNGSIPGGLQSRYHGIRGVTGFSGTTAFGINTINACIFLVNTTQRQVTIDRIAFRVSAVGAGGSVARMGVYGCLPSNYFPTTLLADGGEFDTSAGGGIGAKEAVVSVAIKPAQGVWLCYLCGVAAPTVVSFTNTQAQAYFGVDSAIGTAQCGFIATQAYGALPLNFPVAGLAYASDTQQIVLTARVS